MRKYNFVSKNNIILYTSQLLSSIQRQLRMVSGGIGMSCFEKGRISIPKIIRPFVFLCVLSFISLFIHVTLAAAYELTVSPEDFVIDSEESIVLNATLTLDNNPVEGETIWFIADVGQFSNSMPKTDQNGVVSVTFTAQEWTGDTPLGDTINVILLSDSNVRELIDVTIRPVTPDQQETTLNLYSSENSVEFGESVTLTATLASEGSLINDGRIEFNAAEGGFDDVVKFTNSAGEVTNTYYAPSDSDSDSIQITAKFLGTSDYKSSEDTISLYFELSVRPILVIIKDENNVRLQGVNLELVETGDTGTTDSQGECYLYAPEDSIYHVRASKAGYETKTEEFEAGTGSAYIILVAESAVSTSHIHPHDDITLPSDEAGKVQTVTFEYDVNIGDYNNYFTSAITPGGHVYSRYYAWSQSDLEGTHEYVAPAVGETRTFTITGQMAPTELGETNEDSETIVFNVSTRLPNKGDIQVSVYYPDGTKICPHKSILYDENWNEVTRIKPYLYTYTFSDLNPGIYQTEAYKDNMFIGACENIVVENGLTTPAGITTLSKGLLTVTVTDQNGNPLEGCLVKVYSWNGEGQKWDYSGEATSRSDGTVIFNKWRTTKDGEKYKVVASYDNLSGEKDDIQVPGSYDLTLGFFGISLPDNIEDHEGIVRIPFEYNLPFFWGSFNSYLDITNENNSLSYRLGNPGCWDMIGPVLWSSSELKFVVDQDETGGFGTGKIAIATHLLSTKDPTATEIAAYFPHMPYSDDANYYFQNEYVMPPGEWERRYCNGILDFSAELNWYDSEFSATDADAEFYSLRNDIESFIHDIENQLDESNSVWSLTRVNPALEIEFQSKGEQNLDDILNVVHLFGDIQLGYQIANYLLLGASFPAGALAEAVISPVIEWGAMEIYRSTQAEGMLPSDYSYIPAGDLGGNRYLAWLKGLKIDTGGHFVNGTLTAYLKKLYYLYGEDGRWKSNDGFDFLDLLDKDESIWNQDGQCIEWYYADKGDRIPFDAEQPLHFTPGEEKFIVLKIKKNVLTHLRADDSMADIPNNGLNSLRIEFEGNNLEDDVLTFSNLAICEGHDDTLKYRKFVKVESETGYGGYLDWKLTDCEEGEAELKNDQQTHRLIANIYDCAGCSAENDNSAQMEFIIKAPESTGDFFVEYQMIPRARLGGLGYCRIYDADDVNPMFLSMMLQHVHRIVCLICHIAYR